MAEERGEHRRRHGGELHNASDGDPGQWINIQGGGEQHGRNGDERSGYADGECCSGSSFDHDTAGEPDANGRTDGDVHGGGGRNSTAELPVAEERSEPCGGHGGELHDASNDDHRQRIDLRCGREQHRGDGDERKGYADGECCSRSTHDHDAAGKPDGDGGADSDVHGSCRRNGTAELPVAEERGEHRRSHGGKLHDASNGNLRQRINIPSRGEQHGGDGDKCCSFADRESGSGAWHSAEL